MRTAFACLLVCLAAMSVPTRIAAQDQGAASSALSPEAFQKLKQKALEQTKTVTVPPEAKKTLRLQETASAMECKQLVAGDLTKKYFFIVSTGKDADDVFLSIQLSNGDVTMFLTNSKLVLRNAVTGSRGKNLSAVQNPKAL